MAKTSLFITTAVIIYFCFNIESIISSFKTNQENYPNLRIAPSSISIEYFQSRNMQIFIKTEGFIVKTKATRNYLHPFYCAKCLLILLFLCSNKKNDFKFVALILIMFIINTPDITGGMIINSSIYQNKEIFIRRISRLNEGAFISCGYIQSELSTKAFISKINKDREIEWDYEFTNSFSEKCNAIVTTFDDAYIALEKHINAINIFMRIVKLNSDGIIIWDMLIQNELSYPTAIDIESNNGIIGICGTGINNNLQHICWINSLTLHCDYKCFHNINSAILSGIAFYESSNILAIGTLDEFGILHAYSKETGILYYDKKFLFGQNSNGYAIRRFTDGKFIIAGNCFDGTTKAFIAIISESLNLLNHKIINIPESGFISVSQLPDNSIIASGWNIKMNKQYALFIKFSFELDYDSSKIELCTKEFWPNGIALDASAEYAIENNKNINKISNQLKRLLVNCGPGTFIVIFICWPCSAPFYQDQSNQGSCKTCNAGHYTPDTTRCIQCPPGEYQNQEGQTSCISCPSDEYQDQYGQSSCKTCPEGNYMPDRTQCKPCPAGQYQNLNSQPSCNACISPYYQPNTGQTGCFSCAVGHYRPDSTQCYPCAIGKYQDVAGKTSCKTCPSGQYQDETGKNSCKICYAGNYVPDSTKCIACSAGKYQDQNGQPSCNDCPAGQYQPNTGKTSCIPCLAGNYMPDSTKCIECPAGKYQDQNGQPACNDCPVGQYQPNTGKTSCIPCLAGNYMPDNTKCLQCDPGNYQDENGKSTCKQCEAGYYASSSGTVTCTACPILPNGPLMFTGQSVCQNCPDGKVPDPPTKTSCYCAPGTGLSGGVCKTCDPGYIQSDYANVACSPCGKGYFQSDPGQTSCNQCLAGYYASSEGTVTCTACPILPNGPLMFAGQSVCQNCPDGKVPDPPTKTLCYCAPGTGLSGGVCKTCDPGYIQPDYANMACSPCGKGYFQPDPGKTFCTPCAKGYHQDLTGQPSCQICTKGTYQGNEGQADCIVCQPGQYTDTDGALTYKECNKNYYQPSSGQPKCLPCGPGKYQNDIAQPFCNGIFFIF